ncbi:MAG: hypothetical protein ACI9UQ_000617 [Candidatus Krumholzibacteriia bacterium]|jgi:hypothetical protein
MKALCASGPLRNEGPKWGLRCAKYIAFILEPPVIERLLTHVGEPAAAPEVLPARAPLQSEIPFDQATGSADWPEMDQTASESDDAWSSNRNHTRGPPISRLDCRSGL